MSHTLNARHPAMGTWFEAVLRGDDAGHLGAVASAVFDEVDRVERLLSRHDPRGEVARVNREASGRHVLVGFELVEILRVCRAAWEASDGAFDVAASAGPGPPGRPFGGVEIDPDRRTVRFARPGLALDFGGFGKGYALDRASEIVEAQGVRHALIHGGTSSFRAAGDDGRGDGWSVGVRNPDRPPGVAGELFRVVLRDEGFSCSAVYGHNPGVSDLIDPRRGRELTEPAGCVAVAGVAARADVASTALLVMGRGDARSHAARLAGAGGRVAWFGPGADGCPPAWEWHSGDLP